MQGQRFEGRSIREDDIRACVRRGHPALADLPFADSWCGPIDRTRSGLPLFGALPTCPDIFYGYGFSGNGLSTTPIAGRILASLALGAKDEWSQCGLVRPAESWLPPEPIRYVGALMVRAAIKRKDALAYEDREPGPRAPAGRPGARRHHDVARQRKTDRRRAMPEAKHFPFDKLPFIPCKAPGGETRIARVINREISQQHGRRAGDRRECLHPLDHAL